MTDHYAVRSPVTRAQSDDLAYLHRAPAGRWNSLPDAKVDLHVIEDSWRPDDVPASLNRLLLPWHFDYRGDVIFLTSDTLVLTDLEPFRDRIQRINGPRGRSCVWCALYADVFDKYPRYQSSIMLIDCDAARGWRPEKFVLADRRRQYELLDLSFVARPLPMVLDVSWNQPDTYVEAETHIVRYTRTSTRPWKQPPDMADPAKRQWLLELQDAITCGDVREDAFARALEQHELHPSYRRFLGSFGDKKVRRREAFDSAYEAVELS
jgi:hypothetical protein